jgi:hypothetical protein
VGNEGCRRCSDVAVLPHGLRQPPAQLFMLDDAGRFPLRCGTVLVIWVARPNRDRVLRKGDRMLDQLFLHGQVLKPAAPSPTQEGPVRVHTGPAIKAGTKADAGAGSGPAPAEAPDLVDERAAAFRIALFCTAAALAAVCSSLFT